MSVTRILCKECGFPLAWCKCDKKAKSISVKCPECGGYGDVRCRAKNWEFVPCHVCKGTGKIEKEL